MRILTLPLVALIAFTVLTGTATDAADTALAEIVFYVA